jgi:hypothetical protein
MEDRVGTSYEGEEARERLTPDPSVMKRPDLIGGSETEGLTIAKGDR